MDLVVIFLLLLFFLFLFGSILRSQVITQVGGGGCGWGETEEGAQLALLITTLKHS